MQAEGVLAEMLSRFPGPVTLYPSRRRWLLILLGSVTFVAIGIWMLIKDSPSDWSFQNNTGAWVVILFFGIGVVIAIGIMLPGAAALKLDRDDFEITNFFRRHSIRWPDASGFAVAAIPPSGQKVVVFDYASAGGGLLVRLSIAIAGGNAALPDTYGLSADDLASLMAQWRELALRR